MMECPRCGREIEPKTLPNGKTVRHCQVCGWGQERVEAALGGEEKPRREGRVTGKTFIKLGLMWLITLLIILGPYYLIVYGIGAGLSQTGTFQTLGLSPTPESVSEAINPKYWYVIGIYLLICLAFSPGYDPDNLGLFGSPMVDNPFTYEDDWNRMMLTFVALMLPGKFVLWTLHGSWQVLKAVARIGS